jgi:hypothetical protein
MCVSMHVLDACACVCARGLRKREHLRRTCGTCAYPVNTCGTYRYNMYLIDCRTVEGAEREKGGGEHGHVGAGGRGSGIYRSLEEKEGAPGAHTHEDWNQHLPFTSGRCL